MGCSTTPSPSSRARVREAANEAIRAVAERRGLGRFLKLTETQGAYAAHPLGGCRMADSPDLGVVDDSGAVYGYEGLYCIDSSIIPTSLGVNPSLTIAAVSERAAEQLVARAGDLGLPARPAGFKHGIPPEIVGERVVPVLPPRPKHKRKRPSAVGGSRRADRGAGARVGSCYGSARRFDERRRPTSK